MGSFSSVLRDKAIEMGFKHEEAKCVDRKGRRVRG
jgi:hypothetical protein